jgi:Mur ligase family, catalytic domain
MTARALWTVEAMASAMGAQRQGPLPESVSGLSIDSRTVAPGEAFFAIRGDRRDGHDFVVDALAAKAALAVVAADRRAQFPADAPLLIVSDVLGALRDLAAAARARTHGKVIGVTERLEPRKRCAWHCQRTAKRMLPSPPTTIIGAYRYRWRVVPQARAMRCSKWG